MEIRSDSGIISTRLDEAQEQQDTFTFRNDTHGHDNIGSTTVCMLGWKNWAMVHQAWLTASAAVFNLQFSSPLSSPTSLTYRPSCNGPPDRGACSETL